MTVELTRRERKKEETRDRIFKAAIALFAQKGFEATTIDEITERADVAKGTFFNYFPKKEAVLGYLIENRIALAEENAEAILAESRPAREKLIAFFILAGSAYEDDRELSRFVFVELMKRAFTPVEEAIQRLDLLLARIFQQGQASGELRKDLDPQRAVQLLGDAYITTVHGWLFCFADKGDYVLGDEIRARLTMVFEGLAAKRTRP